MMYVVVCVILLVVFLAWVCSDRTSDEVADGAVAAYGILLAAAFLLLPVWA